MIDNLINIINNFILNNSFYGMGWGNTLSYEPFFYENHIQTFLFMFCNFAFFNLVHFLFVYLYNIDKYDKHKIILAALLYVFLNIILIGSIFYLFFNIILNYNGFILFIVIFLLITIIKLFDDDSKYGQINGLFNLMKAVKILAIKDGWIDNEPKYYKYDKQYYKTNVITTINKKFINTTLSKKEIKERKIKIREKLNNL